MKEVDFDMSAEYVSLGMCFKENAAHDILLRAMGYPGWSENNCRALLLDFISVNCSLSLTKGFKEIKMEHNNKMIEEMKQRSKIFCLILNAYN